MSRLFQLENSDSDGELRINKGYATNYENWRQKEELNKLKTKYRELKDNEESSEGSQSSSSDDEDEDEEEEEEVKRQFDKDFYKALACLKSKDAKIYEKEVNFFEESNRVREQVIEKKGGEKKPVDKAIFLRDYERQLMLEKNGKLSDESDDSDEEKKRGKKKKKQDGKLTYVQEQEELKASFRSALRDEEMGTENGELLKPKEKSHSEKQQEEADYKQWLKGERAKINETEVQELKPLRDFWNNPKLEANEKFLRDYILNNKYLEENRANGSLDYEQVAHDSDENLSEDEKNIEKQEEFEHKYNFRFEEPDREFIKRYPRTMENSLRKKDTRRAEKRAEVKKRKEEEKLRKKEELMQLKALKRKEIEEKIEKLKEITGNEDLEFNALNLDDDFDPEEHDKKMSAMFNEEFYAAEEADVKPEFPDIDAELEIEHTWDDYDPSTDALDNLEPHCEDPHFNMDADYDVSKAAEREPVDGAKRKRRRRTKFAELIAKEKPKFDPQKYENYAEYFDKYYSLNYEDMIGDLPCRFKYRKVVPNDYGLTVEEILTADDRELNKWCSLKKALQYKPEHVELNEVRTFKQKARDNALKQKVLRSLYSKPEEEEQKKEEESIADVEESGKKRRRKKKKKVVGENGVDVKDEGEKKRKPVNCEESAKKRQKLDPQESTEKPSNAGSTTTRKAQEFSRTEKKKEKRKEMKKKKKKDLKSSGNLRLNDGVTLDAERLKTYGISAKKLKKLKNKKSL